MLCVLEYSSTVAKKEPVFLQINNQPVAISLIVLIVRFRTRCVQFYTFFLLDTPPALIKCKIKSSLCHQ